MPGLPNVLGYELQNAKELLGCGKTITVLYSSTPYEDKKLERKDKEYVVIRQQEADAEIILTVSQFR